MNKKIILTDSTIIKLENKKRDHENGFIDNQEYIDIVARSIMEWLNNILQTEEKNEFNNEKL